MASLPHYDPPGDAELSPRRGTPAGRTFLASAVLWLKRRWWLGLPLLLLPVAMTIRWLLDWRRPRAEVGPAMTHKQAETAREDIGRRADAEIDAIRHEASSGREALRDKFGGP